MNVASEPKEQSFGSTLHNSFNLWRHELKSLVAVTSEIFDSNAFKTFTSVGVVAVSLYNLESNMRLSGLELSSKHYCWNDMKNKDPASISDIVSYQICHNILKFTQDSVVRLSDPSPARILNQIKELGNMQRNKRYLFLYIGHGSPKPISFEGITLIPDDTVGCEILTGKQLLDAISIPSCFIFDADYSGLLFREFADPNSKSDRFAFFSCGPSERVPHKIGLPSDLFTSCLLTPANVAILWGSRQFYSFMTGGVREIPINYFSEENGVKPHLVTFSFEIERLLTVLVVAMAFENMPADMLYNCFFRDSQIGKLFVNFCFFRRIGQEIGINPICYPEIPNLSHHELWEFFDLYIDRVLLRLIQMENNTTVSNSTITGDFSSFLVDALSAIENILKLKIYDSVPSEFSLMPLILSEASLQQRAIFAVCKFIDLGEKAIRAAICYGMMPIIMSLPYNEINEMLLPVAYCAVKMQCYSLNSDIILRSFTCSALPVRNRLIFMSSQVSDQRYLLLIIVLMTVGMLLEYGDNANEVEPEVFTFVINSVSGPSLTVAYWALLYLSQFLAVVPDPVGLAEEFNLMPALEKSKTAPQAEIRAAALSVVSSMVDFERETAESVSNLINDLTQKYAHDPSMLVRMQLVIFAQKLLENSAIFETEFINSYNGLCYLMTILTQDPNQEIADLATSVLKAISVNAPLSSNGLLTSLLSGSISDFLNVKYEKFEKYGFNTKSFIPPAPPPTIFCSVSNQGDLKFAEYDTFKHENHLAAADPIFLDSSHLAFADENCNLIIRNISNHSIEWNHSANILFSSATRQHKISKMFTMNELSALLLTSSGEVSLITDLNSPTPMILDAFSLIPPDAENFHPPVYEYSYIDFCLYSSIDSGIIQPWKLDVCSYLSPLKVADEKINCIHELSFSHKSLAVGCSDFKIVDLREAKTTLSADTPAPPTKIVQSKLRDKEYIVLMEDTGMCKIDFRSPQVVQILNTSDVTNVWMCDWNPLMLMNGPNLYLYDESRHCFPMSQYMSPSVRTETVVNAAFHPSEQSLSIGYSNGIVSTIKIT